MTLTQKVRAKAAAAVKQVSPEVTHRLKDAEERLQRRGGRIHELERRTKRLQARVNRLERELDQQKYLSRRLAELADVVEELLLPPSQRNQEHLDQLIDAGAPRRARR